MKRFKPMLILISLLLINKCTTAVIQQPTLRDIKATRQMQDTIGDKNLQANSNTTYEDQEIPSEVFQPLNQDTSLYNNDGLEQANNTAEVYMPGQQTEAVNTTIINQPVNANTYPHSYIYDANTAQMLNPAQNDIVHNYQQHDIQHTNEQLTHLNVQVNHVANNSPIDYNNGHLMNNQLNGSGTLIYPQSTPSLNGQQVIIINGSEIVTQPLILPHQQTELQISAQSNHLSVQHAVSQETDINISTEVPLEEVELPESIKIKEFDVLEEIVGHLRDTFDAYYALIPKEAEEQGNNLRKTSNLLKFITQISGMVNTVLKNKDLLLSDVKFLEDKLAQMRTNPADMLKFFEIDEEYSRILRLTKRWMKDDPKFDVHFKKITESTNKFNVEVKRLLSSCYDLSKLAQFFMDEIMKLKNSNDVKTATDALQRIDQVIMLIVRVMNMRTNIKASIDNIKSSMNNIRALKTDIQNSMKSTENLAMYYEIQEKEKQTILAASIKASGAIILAHVALILMVFR